MYCLKQAVYSRSSVKAARNTKFSVAMSATVELTALMAAMNLIVQVSDGLHARIQKAGLWKYHA